MTLAAPGGAWVADLSERLHGAIAGMAFLPEVLKSGARGLLDGILGGIDISLFYLLPFFFFLGLVEDSGYLARVAFLMDRLMHRIGLHGLSVIPMMLGLGCTVPAILSTRMIAARRDRMITAVLATLIPCSARTVVILGLVGAVFGVWSVMATYLLVVLVVAISGKVLARFNNHVPPGFLVEMPRYHLPRWRTLWPKTWFRIKDFLVEAWPLLIVGSIVLEWIRHFHLEAAINGLVAPLTSGILGLPAAVGIVLLFGIMRKELALLLLVSAMGVGSATDLARLLSAEQILVFTLFITFYIPCLATVAVLKREFGWKMAAWSAIGTFVLAIVIGLLVRLGFWVGAFLV
jgi:ferrous iron transport protein B